MTTVEATELQEKRTSLRRRIQAWRKIQNIYMPGVRQICEARVVESQGSSDQLSEHPAGTSSQHTPVETAPIPLLPSTPEQPEVIHLWLPSSVPQSLLAAGCPAGLVQKERKLRLAQADDALNELRRQLRISATLLDYKKANIGGTSQKKGTRARTLMSRFRDKTYRCAERYDATYKALSTLDPRGEWNKRLKPLIHSRDLRLPWRDEDEDPSEGKRELSWIWLAARQGGRPTEVASEDEVNDGKFL